MNYVHRDYSWLTFNYRVLQEAKDPSVPLLERLKFLAIYSNNLDEYFKGTDKYFDITTHKMQEDLFEVCFCCCPLLCLR